MEQRKVVRAEQHTEPRSHWRVYQEVVNDNKLDMHCHAFPTETLAWRAAEYGIDPADVDTLLEVVLHEPYMMGHDHTSADHLYSTDQDTARRALMARVREVKKSRNIHDPDGHLDQIRQAHRVNPAELAAMRAHVQHVHAHGHAPNDVAFEVKDHNDG